MGFWEFLSSTTESAKRHAPDTTSLKNAYTTSYSALAHGVSTIHRFVPDGDARSMIPIYASKFAQNAAAYAFQEGFKSIPGGTAFSKIVQKSLDDVKKDKIQAEKLKASGGRRKSMSDVDVEEDVVGRFMAEEFFGNRMFDGMIVGGKRKGEKP